MSNQTFFSVSLGIIKSESNSLFVCHEMGGAEAVLKDILTFFVLA